MTLDQLQTLQSLAQKARQDFLIELNNSEYNYTQLQKITGLSTQQLFRIVNNQKGQPKFESLISAYIRLLEFRGSTPKK